MKKNNGHIPRGRHITDYASAAMEQMEFYCAARPGRPSAARGDQVSSVISQRIDVGCLIAEKLPRPIFIFVRSPGSSVNLKNATASCRTICHNRSHTVMRTT